MLPYRIATLMAALLVAGISGASAQWVTPRAQPSACEGFAPLQQEAQQGMGALQSANERKAPREEFCQIFTKLSGTMSKVSRFLEQHKTLCNIPAEAVQRAKTDHSRVAGYRKQACATAAGPVGPSLSDVLGAPLLPDSTTTKPDSGIFNTLTGNPLSR